MTYEKRTLGKEMKLEADGVVPMGQRRIFQREEPLTPGRFCQSLLSLWVSVSPHIPIQGPPRHPITPTSRHPATLTSHHPNIPPPRHPITPPSRKPDIPTSHHPAIPPPHQPDIPPPRQPQNKSKSFDDHGASFGVLPKPETADGNDEPVAHASLFMQNASVTACCVVLMLLFSYRMEMEQTWHGWLPVERPTLTNLQTNLLTPSLTVALAVKSSEHTVSSSPGGRRHPSTEPHLLLSLARMNAAVRQLDRVISIFAPLSVGQSLSTSSPIGCKTPAAHSEVLPREAANRKLCISKIPTWFL
ncbi:solute carrier family 40 member 1-like [Sigmodon hispidus]